MTNTLLVVEIVLVIILILVTLFRKQPVNIRSIDYLITAINNNIEASKEVVDAAEKLVKVLGQTQGSLK